MKATLIAAAGLALLLLGACGGGEERAGQPSADESDKLDNIAGKLDNEETFDTSPDSLVPADENGVAANAAQPANGANQIVPDAANQVAEPAATNQAAGN